MAIEKVQLGVTAIKELLENGYTWFKKDDLGFGSIQEKYQASDTQVAAIRKHPSLKNLETIARIFVIIDDTKNETPVQTKEPVSKGANDEPHEPLVSVERESTTIETDTDSFSAFANL